MIKNSVLGWPSWWVASALVLTAASARGEVVSAPGHALSVHGPFQLTSARLHELAANPGPYPPGAANDLHATESRREEGEDHADGEGRESFGLAFGEAVAPPSDLAPEGSPGPEAQTPSATTHWKGLPSTGDWAADTQIAASQTHVVVSTRTTIGFFNKAGQLLQQISAKNFFAPAQLHLVGSHGGVRNYFDNRLIFDPYRNRFWLGALVYDTNLADTNLNKFVVAVSKSIDPRDGWWIYWWDAAPGDGQPGNFGNSAGDSADYPLLGIDPTHFVQSNIVADNTPLPRPPGYHLTQQISFVAAADLATGKATYGYQYYDLPDAKSGVLQPVVHHGSTPRSYFVDTTASDRVAVWAATAPLSSVRKLERTYVTVRPFGQPVDAPQKAGGATRIRLTNLGIEPLKAAFRAGKLYVTFNDAVNWFGDGVLTSGRFVRLNLASYPTVPPPEVDRTFGGSSSFYDEPGARVHYGFPTVEVNKSGDAVIVYGRTGTTVYPEVSFSRYPAAGPDIEPSRRLKQGEATFKLWSETVLQLHDLNGAAIDPHDDTAVWIAAPYSVKATAAPPGLGGNVNFAIWVGKILGQAYADLVPAKVVFGPKVVNRGQQLTVTTSVANQGDGNAGSSRVAVSLVKGSSTVKLGEFSLVPVASGKTIQLIASMTVPASLAKGTYTVRTDVDATNLVVEYSGVNNRGTAVSSLEVK